MNESGNRKHLKAAADLEMLLPHLHELVRELRESSDANYLYGRAYWLRRDLGLIVATLGAGTPHGPGSYQRSIFPDRQPERYSSPLTVRKRATP